MDDFDVIDLVADVFEGIADSGKGEKIWPKLLLFAVTIAIVIFVICSIL